MGRAEDLLARIAERGETAIDDLIEERKSEELFLDFKRSSDDGSGAHLSGDDRKNLAKAISGFGNSEGGIVIWGVDCRHSKPRGDVAQAKFKISNVKRFKSLLEGAVSGLTMPPHPNVEHTITENEQGDGFVVTSIPKSYLAPHQSVVEAKYYMRAGSDFVPTPHGVLAGMFGRRPQPEIFHLWTFAKAKLQDNAAIVFDVGLILRNRSAAIARDIFVNLTVRPPGGNSRIGFVPGDSSIWSASVAFDQISQLLSKVHFRLAPEALARAATLHFTLSPPFESGFYIEVTTGCAGSPVKKTSHQMIAVDLRRAYEEFCGSLDGKKLIGRVLGTPDENA